MQGSTRFIKQFFTESISRVIGMLGLSFLTDADVDHHSHVCNWSLVTTGNQLVPHLFYYAAPIITVFPVSLFAPILVFYSPISVFLCSWPSALSRTWRDHGHISCVGVGSLGDQSSTPGEPKHTHTAHVHLHNVAEAAAGLFMRSFIPSLTVELD